MAEKGYTYTRVHVLVAAAVALFVMVAGITAFAPGSAGSARVPSKAPVDPTAEAEHYRQVRDYTDATTLNQTIAWNNAMAANYWAGILLLAENYVPPPPPRPVVAARASAPAARSAPAAPRASGGSVSGSCGSGWAMGDGTMMHESNGNPNARNASGAWGCAQIMPGTWASNGCEGSFGSASVDQQKACAAKVMASGGRSQWTAAP